MRKFLPILLFILIPAFALAGMGAKGPDWEWSLRTTSRPGIDGQGVGDGTFVRASSATWVDDDGVVQTATTNIPRFELVGGRRSLLLELAATNLLTYSEDFAGNWTDSGIAAVANVTGPDGGANSATTITGDNGDTTEYTNLAFNPATDNAIYTATVYAKEGSSAWFTVLIQDTGAPATRAEIDFQWSGGDLTVGASDTGTGAVKQVGTTTWWRAIVYVPVNTVVEANAHEIRIYPTRNGVQAATTNIFFGAQVEECPIATSYVPTSGATATRATESGHPYWTLPSNIFAETLGAEEATGTLTIGNVYKITATDGDYFYVGDAVGEYFAATAETALDATNKVQQVTDAWDNAPPHGTLVTWWRLGFGPAAMTAGTQNAAISLTDNSQFLHAWKNTGAFRSQDGTTAPNDGGVSWTSEVWYKIAVQWGILNNNVSQYRVGRDSGSGISWGSWSNFDGAYTTGGNGFRLGYGLFGPMHMQWIGLWRRQLTDSEIESYH